MNLSECSQEPEFIKKYIQTYLDTISTPIPLKIISPHDTPQEIQRKQDENKNIQETNQHKERIKHKFNELKNHDPNIIETIREYLGKKITDIFEENVIIDYLVDEARLTLKGLGENGIREFLKEKSKLNFIETYILQTAAELFAGVFSYIYSPDPKERERSSGNSKIYQK